MTPPSVRVFFSDIEGFDDHAANCNRGGRMTLAVSLTFGRCQVDASANKSIGE